MKKLFTVIGVLALAGIIIYSQRTTLVARLMERGLEARLGADVITRDGGRPAPGTMRRRRPDASPQRLRALCGSGRRQAVVCR